MDFHKLATSLSALAPHLSMPSLAKVSKAAALEMVLCSPQRELPCQTHLTGAPRGLLGPRDLLPSELECAPANSCRLQLHHPSHPWSYKVLYWESFTQSLFILLINSSASLEDLSVLAKRLQLCVFIFIIVADRSILSFKSKISLSLERSDLESSMQEQN